MNNLKPIIEALLFASEAPLSINEFGNILDSPHKEIKGALREIDEELQGSSRGIDLVEANGGYQLRTKPEFASWVGKLSSEKPLKLSVPAIETLAIVAYQQPITRAEVERIRGVDVGAVLKTLLERRLIKIIGRKEEVGHPLLYATSGEFLEVFGLKDLKELPPLKELEQKGKEIAETSIAPQPDIHALATEAEEYLDAKEKETLFELDDCLKQLKESDKKVQKIISPEIREAAESEVSSEEGEKPETLG